MLFSVLRTFYLTKQGAALFHDSFLEILGEIHLNLLAGTLYGYLRHIGVNHEVDELFEARLLGRIPTKLLAGLRRIAPEVHHIRRTVEIRRYLDQYLAGLPVDTFLVLTLTLEH